MNKCILCDKPTETKYCSQTCYHSRDIEYSKNKYKIQGDVAIFETTSQPFTISVEDVDKVRSRLWHYTSSNGVVSNLRRGERPINKGGHIKLHRYITDAPVSMVVDHMNGDKSDNRRSNLRIVEHWENIINSKSKPMRNIEKRKNSNTFCVRLKRKGVRHYIGNYPTIEEAIEARDKAAKSIHGELRLR